MDKPIKLLFFYAGWCRLCKIVAPKLEELQQEYAGRVEFQFIDIEKTTDLAIEYEVRSLPTLVLIEKEKPLWRNVGEFTDTALVTVLDHFCS